MNDRTNRGEADMDRSCRYAHLDDVPSMDPDEIMMERAFVASRTIYANAPENLQAAGIIISALVARDAKEREPEMGPDDILGLLLLALGSLSLALEDPEEWEIINQRISAVSLE